jgi:predicted LPLAT superfamily acyltransferase
MLKVAECLENGAMVGMLGDRIDQNSKAVECELLGEKALFPSAPALLASALKVPVVLFFGLYRGKGRYDIYFELFAEETVLDRENREQAAQMWMQSYCARLEYYTKLAPYNWFNFYDFWGEFE